MALKHIAASGNPIEAMDLGLTLQARSLAAMAAGGLPATVQSVPPDVERRIAEDLVSLLGGPGARPRPS